MSGQSWCTFWCSASKWRWGSTSRQDWSQGWGASHSFEPQEEAGLQADREAKALTQCHAVQICTAIAKAQVWASMWQACLHLWKVSSASMSLKLWNAVCLCCTLSQWCQHQNRHSLASHTIPSNKNIPSKPHLTCPWGRDALALHVYWDWAIAWSKLALKALQQWVSAVKVCLQVQRRGCDKSVHSYQLWWWPGLLRSCYQGPFSLWSSFSWPVLRSFIHIIVLLELYNIARRQGSHLFRYEGCLYWCASMRL